MQAHLYTPCVTSWWFGRRVRCISCVNALRPVSCSTRRGRQGSTVCAICVCVTCLCVTCVCVSCVCVLVVTNPLVKALCGQISRQPDRHMYGVPCHHPTAPAGHGRGKGRWNTHHIMHLPFSITPSKRPHHGSLAQKLPCKHKRSASGSSRHSSSGFGRRQHGSLHCVLQDTTPHRSGIWYTEQQCCNHGGGYGGGSASQRCQGRHCAALC